MENKQNIKELSWYIFNKYIRKNFNVKDSLIKHSITTAKICEEMSIYSNKNIDTNLAFACGLLHDIGKIKSKSTGLMHAYEGYMLLAEHGLYIPAKATLLHSFVLENVDKTEQENDLIFLAKATIKEHLEELKHDFEYNKYIYLTMLADSMASIDKMVTIEEKIEYIKEKYGNFDFLEEKKEKLKELFKLFFVKNEKELVKIINERIENIF